MGINININIIATLTGTCKVLAILVFGAIVKLILII